MADDDEPAEKKEPPAEKLARLKKENDSLSEQVRKLTHTPGTVAYPDSYDPAKNFEVAFRPGKEKEAQLFCEALGLRIVKVWGKDNGNVIICNWNKQDIAKTLRVLVSNDTGDTGFKRIQPIQEVYPSGRPHPKTDPLTELEEDNKFLRQQIKDLTPDPKIAEAAKNYDTSKPFFIAFRPGKEAEAKKFCEALGLGVEKAQGADAENCLSCTWNGKDVKGVENILKILSRHTAVIDKVLPPAGQKMSFNDMEPGWERALAMLETGYTPPTKDNQTVRPAATPVIDIEPDGGIKI